MPGGWELVLVVLVIMVLFGAKRLPEASRSLGRSMRILKAETKGLRDTGTRAWGVHGLGGPVTHRRPHASSLGHDHPPQLLDELTGRARVSLPSTVDPLRPRTAAVSVQGAPLERAEHQRCP